MSVFALPRWVFLLIACAAVLLCGCSRNRYPVIEQMAAGDVEEGRHLTYAFACGTCHKIPGVSGATGNVGPPLTGFAARAYIAGALANTPENLSRWIMHPQLVEPGTVMPNLDVSPEQSRHIAAFLYTLR